MKVSAAHTIFTYRGAEQRGEAGGFDKILTRLTHGILPHFMTTPCVGIFWGIRDAARGMILLADKTPIDKGEQYGECITHPNGHYEFWEGLSQLGATALANRGLPTAPAWHEYEEFPRGRVVYWPGDKRFVIYADRCLQTTAFIDQLVAEFGIPNGSYAVRSDPHYRSQATEL